MDNNIGHTSIALFIATARLASAANCAPANMEDIIRNPAVYDGKVVAITGEIEGGGRHGSTIVPKRGADRGMAFVMNGDVEKTNVGIRQIASALIYARSPQYRIHITGDFCGTFHLLRGERNLLEFEVMYVERYVVEAARDKEFAQ